MEEEKITTPHSLKNEFRDEVRDPYAGIPEEELIKRDQAVLLKQLRFREYVYKSNRENVQRVIQKANSLMGVLLAMPKSPFREEVIADIKKTLELNQSQYNANIVPLNVEVTLLALEELLMPETEPYEPAAQVGTVASGANPEEDDPEYD